MKKTSHNQIIHSSISDVLIAYLYYTYKCDESPEMVRAAHAWFCSWSVHDRNIQIEDVFGVIVDVLPDRKLGKHLVWDGSVYWGGPDSQSCCPIADVQGHPTGPCHLSFTLPQGVGRGCRPDGSWGPSGILSAASSPPPSLRAPGPTSTLWPSLPFLSPKPRAPTLVSAAWLSKHSPSPK